ncbi:hypothetical protein [uncultured Thalassospira sp.]|uniref:hypothetical protein n=1 Tax=uncultured Thalassospira sp. TaxID=404382 RepID=UPI00258ACA8E|nr:hypothetical protein [uncultured Thalassospira sp.]
MIETFNLVKARHDLEAARSAVRRRVTYWVVMAYLAMAGILLLWLMYLGRHEIAVSVLAGVSGLTGSIVGFWFGARKPQMHDEQATTNDSSPAVIEQALEISGPVICRLVHEISAQMLEKLQTETGAKQSVKARLTDGAQVLLGTVSIKSDKLSFNFEKVQLDNVVAPLTKQLVGLAAVPSPGKSFGENREILLV